MPFDGLAATAVAGVLIVAVRCTAGVLGPRLQGLPQGLVDGAARAATLVALAYSAWSVWRLPGPAGAQALGFALTGLCVFALSRRLPLALAVAAAVSVLLHAWRG